MTLQDDALRLAKLDQEVGRALCEGDVENLRRVLLAYVELRESLRIQLLDESVISVGDVKAGEILRKVASGSDLQSDEFIKQLRTHGGGEPAAEEFDDLDTEELGLELFYSWYSHHEYITALAELRPLILRCSTSNGVRRLVGEVKQCYAFQQYNAVFAMCRALLEESAREIGEQRGLGRIRGKYGPDLFKKVSNGPLRKKLGDLYGRLSKVSHALREATAEDARKVFQKTLSAVEELYEIPRP